MKSLRGRDRRGITPVVATVILIAVTLIAAVAITGFTFGLFGAFTASAQVTVTASSLSASGITGGLNNPTATCSSTAGAGSYIQLTNTGTATVGIASFALTEGGTTTTFAMASCGNGNPATAGNTVYILLTGVAAPPASSGTQYLGNVVLQNGAVVPVSGTFLA